jgi:hypothetical protein
MNSTTFENFRRITGQDAQQFLSDFLSFLESDFNIIASYYSGTSEVNPSESINRLVKLDNQLSEIESVVELKSTQLNRYDYWELQEEFLLAREQLDTAFQLPKWVRTSRVNGFFTENPTVDYFQKQGETLEGIQRTVIGSTDPDNDYYKTGVQNRVNEEKYSNEGGLKLKIELSSPQSFTIDSIVDVLDDNLKLYGLDINKKITYKENDLDILGYRNTLEQSAFILLNLRKEDNPEFPNMGVDKRIAVGGNLASFSYPVVLRQIYETFKTDDTFASIELVQINNVEDSLSFDFRIEPKQGDFIETGTVL